jgi:hypothetical protein
VDDPLDAEAWASAMLGAFYQVDAPLDARDELERTLWPAVIMTEEAAVDEHSTTFREAMTDADQFGPAKAIGHAMLADGVDLSDRAAVDRWIAEYNDRQDAG